MTLDLERERVVQELCSAYAHDQLTTGELETRLDQAYKSTDRGELATLLMGIPAVHLPVPAPRYAPPPTYAPAPRSPARPAPDARGRALPPDEARFVSVFSEIKKVGAWVVKPRITARTIFGSIHLDMREAEIPMQGVDIDIDATLAEAIIILPPGVGADVDCSSILGTVEDKTKPALPGAPRVRVRGGAVMASITVVTKMPKKEGAASWRSQLKYWLGLGEEP
jgi:hypothetical protein